jgi:hypothetical protein
MTSTYSFPPLRSLFRPRFIQDDRHGILNPTILTAIGHLTPFLRLTRVFIAILILAILNFVPYPINHGRRRQNAFGVLALVFSAVDCFPYMVYTWQREPFHPPFHLIRWVMPLSTAVSVYFHAAWVRAALAEFDAEFVIEIYFIWIVVIFAICETMLMTILWLCFFFCSPLKLPPVYAPVSKVAGQNQWHGDDLLAWTNSFESPLEKLYREQKCLDNNIEEREEEEYQHVTNTTSVSMGP